MKNTLIIRHLSGGGEITLPNVSFCKDAEDNHYNPLASFMFISEEKRVEAIPFVSGLTSEVFKNSVPDNSFYGGFISTPISSFGIEGKTNEEIDAMFAEYKRANLSKKSIELSPSNVYKTITFPKIKYLNDMKLIRHINTTTQEVTSIHILSCMPNNLFRNEGIIIDGDETQHPGVFAESFGDGQGNVYTSQDLFGVDGKLVIVDATSFFEQGQTYSLKAYYTTFDNITIVTDVLKTYTFE